MRWIATILWLHRLSGPPQPTAEDTSEIPRAGPPAEEPPPGAAIARPEHARRLSMRPREPEDIALAVPRTILSVPRMVLVGVFTPVAKVLYLFDDRVVARLRRVFLWNRAETIGWRPTLEFQGGYGFSGGARVFHKSLFGNGEYVHVEALAGGVYLQSYEARVRGDTIGGSRVSLDMRGRYDVSPGLVFHGLGNPPPPKPGETETVGPRDASVHTRYSQKRGLAAGRVGYRFGEPRRAFRPGLGFIFNHRRFGRDRRRTGSALWNNDGEPSIEEVYDVDSLVGFEEGVDVVQLFGIAEVDTRNHLGRPSRGLHFTVLGGGAPPQARDVAFAHYGGELAGYFDLFHHTRILVARVGLDAVHGEDRRIPFSELPRLGGPMRLRGYRLGRFRDRRAVFGTLEYHFPIHQLLAGHLFVDGGRVARSYAELVTAEVRPWRIGYGGGFTFRTLERWYMRIDLSYGEEFLVFFSTDAIAAFADRYRLEL
jgi:hypothetical protein